MLKIGLAHSIAYINVFIIDPILRTMSTLQNTDYYYYSDCIQFTIRIHHLLVKNFNMDKVGKIRD